MFNQTEPLNYIKKGKMRVILNDQGSENFLFHYSEVLNPWIEGLNLNI